MLTCNELSDAYVKVTNEGQRENARGMSARRVITMSVLFRHIYKVTAPPARVNLWVGGWLPARVGLC